MARKINAIHGTFLIGSSCFGMCIFSVEPEDFPAAKHMCESSIDREPGMPNLHAARPSSWAHVILPFADRIPCFVNGNAGRD
jgi:hypothetical protein